MTTQVYRTLNHRHSLDRVQYCRVILSQKDRHFTSTIIIIGKMGVTRTKGLTF